MGFDKFNIKELGLIDRTEELSFDHLTQLATLLFDVPVALVSIIDPTNDRQFFKSSQGLPEPWKSKGETPLSHSFCKHVVDQNSPLIVSNSRQHPLVSDNLAIQDLNVLAYLGVPVHDPHGQALGALCAIDGKPRDWTGKDLEKLQSLAICVNDIIRMKSALLSNKLIHDEKADFDYALSHDIKAPINSLKTLLAELDPIFKDDNATEHTMFVNKAIEMTNRLEQTTASILRFGELKKSQSPFPKTDLNEVATEVLDEMTDIVSQAGAVVSIGPLPVIRANAIESKLLLENLISNAIKFQPPGQIAKVNLQSQSEAFEDILTITDNGIGIDILGNDKECIFERFSRLNNRMDYPGTGLGLALCTQIVRNLNGRICVNSEPNQGTKIKICLPKAL
jgi:signal transduction histidine kinase